MLHPVSVRVASRCISRMDVHIAGVDFRFLSVVTIQVPSAAAAAAGARAKVAWPVAVEATSQKVREQPAAKALCDRYQAVMTKRMGKVVANQADASGTLLDTSEALVRMKESPAGLPLTHGIYAYAYLYVHVHVHANECYVCANPPKRQILHIINQRCANCEKG